MKSVGFRLTKREDFAEIEKNSWLTTPNIISAGRAIGGVALGFLMAKGDISASTAIIGSAVAAASDAEGSLINVAKKWPSKVRDGLRIWPSEQGVKADVIADKIYTVAALAGGAIGGYINKAAGLIFVPEVATVAASVYAKNKLGEDPVVGREGKLGMIARFSAIGSYLVANAFQDESMPSRVMEGVGHASTATALVLGAMSCWDIIKQGRNAEPHINLPAETQ